ncbi:cyclic pyranopterin monophosphate synthase subunit MoaA [Virgibacillus subterraneus]|uniref:GTP 3',8-cyclase n=2 Tax=Virgibacillus TaxID=84406 RepID=A0A1H1CMW4_9BACI|nr:MULTISPECIES: GTP 3',8-cyclase MoaA [Virgibacillus]SDQ65554.1 cyclic pyranopterin monophosphate synthase subunit MoaA [Virgibacillus salinus]SEQ63881.1 cyclic pyranopterin monophosphate synthase subunit MoaA [Virgibacillus subterraneus]
MRNEVSPIKDHFGRALKDLRISVIDKCNFRCTYCMPKEIFGKDHVFLSENELLSFDEIVRLAKTFAKLGVEKIRITGGEPLMRRNLDELIAQLTVIPGIKDIALTTNAVFLPKTAKKLKAAGLKRVNISLDAIEDEVFKQINGKGVVARPVLKGIEAAQEAGLEVKINMVAKKGMNESQVLPMARYFKGTNIILRYIEFMDVGNHNGWDFNNVITKKQIIDMIDKEMPLEPAEENYYGEVASRYRYKDGGGEIGVISSVSDSFCGTCTRIRLSADGKLYTCLFASSGFDIREKMRDELTDEQLEEEVTSLWGNRRDRYSEERSEQKNNNRKKIEMSYIGG